LFFSIRGKRNHLKWKQHSLHVPTKSRKLELGMHSRFCWTCMEILVLAQLQFPPASHCRCRIQILLRFRHPHHDRTLDPESLLFCNYLLLSFFHGIHKLCDHPSREICPDFCVQGTFATHERKLMRGFFNPLSIVSLPHGPHHA